MNRTEVKNILVSSGVSPDDYSLNGGLPFEAYCLEPRGGTWAVYYSERGRRSSEKVFATEDEACREFLDRVLGDLGRR
ncbi:hypothetical protein [Actinacidiphila epipremni]|uniref:Uncharacterized protein n=1 Tax=Actinacidiphila epipremni TaxID=2053013 RepID=A0ABX0ZP80_9ACTN|nr:hypothetical protein [Actinacidiphila epipremni]NJP43403.1 hypothetical protein [Actinacidiphila epipremni]